MCFAHPLPTTSLPFSPTYHTYSYQVQCGLLKVLHERYRSESTKQRPTSECVAFKRSLQEVAESNRDLQPHIHKAQVNTHSRWCGGSSADWCKLCLMLLDMFA